MLIGAYYLVLSQLRKIVRRNRILIKACFEGGELYANGRCMSIDFFQYGFKRKDVIDILLKCCIDRLNQKNSITIRRRIMADRMFNLYRHPIITVVFKSRLTQTGIGDIESVKMPLAGRSRHTV